MRMLAATLALAASLATAAPPPNPQIDSRGFVDDARAAAMLRETRRVDEATFVRMMREPGTVVLDARSRERFQELHIEGAVNLPFPDIEIATLAELLPDKSRTILIYCNNNFTNAERSFGAKIATASLNLSTYVVLYDYGYRNVYELGPRLDVRTTRLPLAGREATAVLRGCAAKARTRVISLAP